MCVCLFPNYSETVNPNELKILRDDSPWDGEGFRLKNPGPVPGSPEKRKNERSWQLTQDGSIQPSCGSKCPGTQINRHHIWQLGLNHYICSGEATSIYSINMDTAWWQKREAVSY